MRCEQARQLFDAYLNGDLSSAMATEVAAHRVQCSDCRRELALLEVSGHIIASDRDPVSLDEDFSDRLLACVEGSRRHWVVRLRRSLYVAGPLAAAAVIALSVLGVFDHRRETRVAGVTETAVVPPAFVEDGSLEDLDAIIAADVPQDNQTVGELDRWGHELQERSQIKRQSVESLLQSVDLTVGQWIDILEEADPSSPVDDFLPGAEPMGPSVIEEPPVSADIPDADAP